MSAKKVLDGVNALRTIANHPNMTNDEKVAAFKVSVEEVRNDIQDLTDTVYDNYEVPNESTATPEQIENIYQKLKEQDIHDLIFFYKKSVFMSMEDQNDRYELARILVRVASEKETKAPAIWTEIAGSAGVINEE